jgi:hypothetical protein
METGAQRCDQDIFCIDEKCFISSRSGLVVKFVLAMHEPRVRFTAATFVLSFCRSISSNCISF